MSIKFQAKVQSKFFTLILFFFFLSINLLAQNRPPIEDGGFQDETEMVDTTANSLSQKSGTTPPTDFNAAVNHKKPTRTKEAEINSNFYISIFIDLVALLLIIGLIYYPNYKRLDTIFTFVTFNVTIFLLTFLLNQVKISMGAAFGLFAVFSMLRYRTAGISVKDMTYLFVFIAMGLLSGIQLEIKEILIIFAVLFIILFLLDTKLLIKRESTKVIFLDDISLIHTDKHDELIADLKNRTGLNIHRISIDEISYLRDSATITIYYYE